MKRSTKRTLKTIALGLLGLLVVGGAVAGISSLVSKQDEELKEIHPTFEIGGLSEVDGKFEKSETTLYTKEAFECQGLEIKLEFDNYINYEVFYYMSNGNFIESSGLITDGYTAELPLFATHARIEITPNWAEMGEDYQNAEKQIVKWYETTKYASQIEVKVSKDQSALDYSNNLFENKNIGKIFGGDVNAPTDSNDFSSSAVIDVRDYDKLFIVRNDSSKNLHAFAVYDEQGSSIEVVTSTSVVWENDVCVIDLTEYNNATSFVMTYLQSNSNVFEIYGLK